VLVSCPRFDAQQFVGRIGGAARLGQVLFLLAFLASVTCTMP
jgi:hypothetical protein